MAAVKKTLLLPSGVLDQFTVSDLMNLEEQFRLLDVEGRGSIDENDFKKAVVAALGDENAEASAEELFQKIDGHSKGRITWLNFVTHVLQIYNERTLEAVSAEFRPFCDTPVIHPCLDHNDTTVAMQIYPKPDGVKDFIGGDIVNLSRSGHIFFMSPDMEIVARNYIDESKKGQVNISCIAMACLPDVDMIAISTSCWDVRFYDSSPSNFQKHFAIVEFPKCVTTIDYHVKPRGSDKSLMIVGDDDGSIHVLWMANSFFLNLKMSMTLKEKLSRIMYVHLSKKLIRGLELTTFSKIHSESVNKVKFFSKINTFMSCSSCTKEALAIYDFSRKTMTCFKSQKGIMNFDYSNANDVIICGCRDNTVKMWNRLIPERVSRTLRGHVSPVAYVLADDDRSLVISLSKIKIVKIWHATKGVCLQTLKCDMAEMGRHDVTCVVYNPLKSRLVVHTHQIAVFHAEAADTATCRSAHTKPVCAALYSRVFHSVVTGGEDSVVAVWDLKSGKKTFQFGHAHWVVKDDFESPVAITAMCFDMAERRLATGGRNGTVKIWNYNNGVCLRTFHTEGDEAVNAIALSYHTFYVVGCNRLVTIIYDDGASCFEKTWKEIHGEDIMDVAIYRNGLVATAGYDGDIVLWVREIGVPRCILQDDGAKYRYYALSDKRAKDEGKVTELPQTTEEIKSGSQGPVNDQSYDIGECRKISKLIFLQNRPIKKDVGTLVSCGSYGMVRVWSVCPGSGVLARFSATGQSRSGLVSMATDKANKYLVMGDTEGYVRVWHIEGFCHSEETIPTERDEEHYLLFPYLRLQKCLEERGFRSSRKTSRETSEEDPDLVTTRPPTLLNCFRAHMDSVTHIEYVDDGDFLVTGGYDGSVRIWHVSGRYIGCFGQNETWNLESLPPVPSRTTKHMPPDIRKFGSPTTCKVINNGGCPLWSHALRVLRNCKRKGTVAIPGKEARELGKRYDKGEPILGKFHRITEKPVPSPRIPPLYDINFKVSVFSELEVADTESREQVTITPNIAKSLIRSGFITRHKRNKAKKRVTFAEQT